MDRVSQSFALCHQSKSKLTKHSVNGERERERKRERERRKTNIDFILCGVVFAVSTGTIT